MTGRRGLLRGETPKAIPARGAAERSGVTRMDRRERRLRYAAGLLALVVAGVHLYWGIPRFVAYASVGVMPDPRPAAFVLSGHAILLAVTLVAAGVLDARRTYVPGVALMVVHVASYAAWHTVFAHGVPGAEAVGVEHGHLHVGNAVVVVLQHVVNSPLALVSKLAELAVVVLLAWLYVGEAGDGIESP